MPELHDTLVVVPGAPRPISNGSTASVRVHNISGAAIDIQATATASPPTSRRGAIPLAVGQTMAADLTLAQLFPGVGVGPFWLWAYAAVPTDISVSHA